MYLHNFIENYNQSCLIREDQLKTLAILLYTLLTHSHKYPCKLYAIARYQDFAQIFIIMLLRT